LWSDNFSFKAVSYSKILLKNAKLTSNKISGSKSTICKIKSNTTSDDLERIAIKDYSLLKSKLKEQTFNYFEPYNEVNRIYIIKTEKIDNILYDNIEQKLKFEAYDINNKTVNFEIKFNLITENMIKRLERNKNIHIFNYILASIKESNNLIIGNFICAMNKDKMINLIFK